MSGRKQTVRRQTVHRQVQSLGNIIGSVELTILDEIYQNLSQNRKVTPEVATEMLDEFSEFITFDIAHVYEILNHLNKNKVVSYAELATWVKVVYIVHLRKLYPNNTDFKIMAQTLLKEDNSAQVGTQLINIILNQPQNSQQNILQIINRSGIRVGDKSGVIQGGFQRSLDLETDYKQLQQGPPENQPLSFDSPKFNDFSDPLQLIQKKKKTTRVGSPTEVGFDLGLNLVEKQRPVVIRRTVKTQKPANIQLVLEGQNQPQPQVIHQTINSQQPNIELVIEGQNQPQPQVIHKTINVQQPNIELVIEGQNQPQPQIIHKTINMQQPNIEVVLEGQNQPQPQVIHKTIKIVQGDPNYQTVGENKIIYNVTQQPQQIHYQQVHQTKKVTSPNTSILNTSGEVRSPTSILKKKVQFAQLPPQQPKLQLQLRRTRKPTMAIKKEPAQPVVQNELQQPLDTVVQVKSELERENPNLKEVANNLMYLGPLSGLSLLSNSEKPKQYTQVQEKKEDPVQRRKLHQILSPGNGEVEEYKPMIVKVAGPAPALLISAEIPMEPRQKIKVPKLLPLDSPYSKYLQCTSELVNPYYGNNFGRVPQKLLNLTSIENYLRNTIHGYSQIMNSSSTSQNYNEIVEILHSLIREIEKQRKSNVRFYRKTVPFHMIETGLKKMIQHGENLIPSLRNQNTELIVQDVDQMVTLLKNMKTILHQASQQKQRISPTLLDILCTLQNSIRTLQKTTSFTPIQSKSAQNLIKFILKYAEQIPLKPKIVSRKFSFQNLAPMIQEAIINCQQLIPKRQRLGQDEQDINLAINKLQIKLGLLNQQQTPQAPSDPRLDRLRHFKIQTDLPKAIAQQISNYISLQDQRKRLKHDPQELKQVLVPLKQEFRKLTDQEIPVMPAATIFSPPPYDFDDALIESIKELQKIRKQMRHNGEDTDVCDYVLGVFRKAQSRPRVQKVKAKSPPTEESFRLGLLDIFQFYARQPSLADVSKKLVQLASQKAYIKIGKFLSFCLDFNIMMEKRLKSQKSLSRRILTRIFYQNCDDQNCMFQDNFILSIDDIAQEFFDLQYDQIYGTNFKNFSFRQKVMLIYEFIQCDDPLKYGRKMKGYGNPYYVGGARRLRQDSIQPPLAHLATPNLKQMSLSKSARSSPSLDFHPKKLSRNTSRLNSSTKQLLHNKSPSITSNTRSTPNLSISSRFNSNRALLSPRNPNYTSKQSTIGRELKRNILDRADQLLRSSRKEEERYLKRLNQSIRSKYSKISPF